MDISTNLTWRDLIAVNCKLQSRMPLNVIFFLIVICLNFGFTWADPGFESFIDVVVAAFVAVFVGLIAMLVGALISFLCMLLMAAKTPGVLGRHDFSISPAGLKEVTAVNDSMNAWAGIREVIMTRNYLVFYNGMTAHAIPRRAFASQAQFDAFSDQTVAWWKSARAVHPAAA